MRRIYVVLAIALLAACGGDGNNGEGPSGGRFIVQDGGSGPENTDALLPLHSGSVFGPRNAVVRAPVEIVPGRVAHRYIAQPKTLGTSPTAAAQAELWYERGGDGIWFAGSAKDGLLDSPILLVPSTVRLGMRWQTGSQDTERTYEVIARDELDSELGATVFWTVEQQTEVPIYRIYAEGWGLVSLGSDASVRAENLEFYAPLRAVSGSEEATQPDGPTLTLEPALDSTEAGTNLPERFDSIRAVLLDDGEVRINFVGAGQRTITPPILGITAGNLSYRDGVVRSVGTIFPPEADVTKIPPSLPGIGATGQSYEFQMDAFFPIGNVAHLGGRVLYSTEDLLMYENELGGVSAAVISGFVQNVNDRYELPLIDPGYGPENGRSDRPIWGGLPKSGHPRRILIGDGATAESVPFAQVSGRMGVLRWSRLRSVRYGRALDAPEFVEAFPDAVGADLTGKRGPLVSTTSSAAGRVHLFTTPGGMIDRIVVDGDGARRERIGRAALPAGHVLRAAIDPGDGTIVVFTYAPADHSAHVWTARSATPAPIAPAPFIAVEWTQWDARVCWPPSTEPLDAAGWRLGPARAAEVIPIADNCALVIRDLEATPIPDSSLEAFPRGWAVFEGDVPGAGHVRAFEPGGIYHSMFAPAAGAWLRGGGAVAPFAPDRDTGIGLEFSAGGIPRGTAIGLEHLSSSPVITPDASGAGLWAASFSADYPDTCASPCSPESTSWGIALGGPEPAFFPTLERQESPLLPVRSGGVVVPRGRLTESDHRGPMHLRPDGSFVEITIPDRYRMGGTTPVAAVRASGEVCGMGVDLAGVESRWWCARPDGTSVREGAVGSVTGVLGMVDDSHLLASGGVWGPVLVNLDALTEAPYSPGEHVTVLPIGADGVLYGTFIPAGGELTLGAFTVDGFVPLQDIYDVDALGEGAEPSGLLVTENFVALAFDEHTVRIPRSRWNPSGACEATTAPDLDADRDGYVAATSCGDDCDDSDESVNPGVIDGCGDGVDNDCNGVTDTGGPCWEDADGDGFAPDAGPTMNACACPAGWTDREPSGADIDCFDGDPRMFPRQTEYFWAGAIGTAEPFDFDCDGTVDKLYPATGACTHDGMMGCDITSGMLLDVACGNGGEYVGCLEPGRCGACDWGRDIFSGVMACIVAPGASSTGLLLTQSCR
ncbi:MAG: hypothetical protein DRJ42_20155 [Deltaproteobacteria bacterium]|nr:MAG: hypothetical protein DRJ42_20155 [Deltaproteobacteria bacterium]